MEKRKKTEITVAKIIDAALNEFGKNGYLGGTINNICKTGINKGLIYHNFKGKDDLYICCLKYSCEKYIEFIENKEYNNDFKKYIETRMDFFNKYSNEGHILFEALINSPKHLSNQIAKILEKFNSLNEQIYNVILDSITLRENVSREDAISYFHLMQVMLNGYFNSTAFQNMDISEKLKLHEVTVSKMLDYMIYGIAQ